MSVNVKLYINLALIGEIKNWGINIPRLKSTYTAYIGADFADRTECTYEKNNTPKNIYVSLSGSDANSGTAFAPLKTLSMAFDKAYSSESDNISIIMESGEYAADKTLFLPPADKKITVKAKDKNVIISGAKNITDWALYDSSKNIFRAYAGDIDTNSFFVNKQRRQRAKTDSVPNYTYSDSGFSFADTSFYSESAVLYYRYDWCDRIILILQNGNYIPPLLAPAEHEYVVKIETSYSLLDEKGEWYYDKSDKYIYYKPLNNEDINSCDAQVGTSETLIKGIHGSNVIFSGIDFFGTSWTEGDKTVFNHMQAGFCNDSGNANSKKISVASA